MGAQIAAHCVNAGIPVVLFDLAATEGDPNAGVRKSIEHLKKMNPAPLGVDALAGAITAATYEQLDLMADCDLVLEAVAERLDVK